jgi:hypothetical protein
MTVFYGAVPKQAVAQVIMRPNWVSGDDYSLAAEFGAFAS